MRPEFYIFKTRGDGSLERVKGTETLESAKEQVEELAKFWPGKYVILDEATGEKVSIVRGGN